MNRSTKYACLLVALISVDASAEDSIPCDIADDISNEIYQYQYQTHTRSYATVATAINDLSILERYAKSCEGLASDVKALREHQKNTSAIFDTPEVPDITIVPHLERSEGETSITSSEAPKILEMEGGRTGLPIQSFDNIQLRERQIKSSED